MHAELDELVPRKRVMRALSVTDGRTFKSMLERHNVPLTVVGPKKHGLTQANYKLLLKRMTNPVGVD